MTTTESSLMDKWNMLPWRGLERSVFKLQQRIYRALLGTNDSRQMIEEPCDAKVSSTVLKPSGGSDPVA